MTSIEESYSIGDPVICEHVEGSNKYTFRFNQQWRNKQVPLSIGIRKINLNFSPRLFSIHGLSLSNGSKSWNIDPWIIVTGSMAQFNEAVLGYIKTKYEYYETLHTISSSNPLLPKHFYIIYYNPSTKKLVFEITTSENYYFVIDPNVTVSDDFKYITGKENLTDGIITSNSNKITKIVFENVWDRENIYIQASFVDLAYGNYLGVTNDSYYPPKIYPIVFGDQKFWIKLYDSLGNQVELPNDGKDNLIIESIMIA